jgi:hypothetical protein
MITNTKMSITITYLLLTLCSADFLIYYDTQSKIYVNNLADSNCSNIFTINFNNPGFDSNIIDIHTSYTTATINYKNDNIMYKFAYPQIDPDYSQYIYSTLTYVNIYKNNSLVAITNISGNNVTIISPNYNILYVINQNYKSKCSLPNAYSYYVITINNTIISEYIMASGIAVLLQIVESDYRIYKFMIDFLLYILLPLFGLCVILFCCGTLFECNSKKSPRQNIVYSLSDNELYKRRKKSSPITRSENMNIKNVNEDSVDEYKNNYISNINPQSTQNSIMLPGEISNRNSISNIDAPSNVNSLSYIDDSSNNSIMLPGEISNRNSISNIDAPSNVNSLSYIDDSSNNSN